MGADTLGELMLQVFEHEEQDRDFELKYSRFPGAKFNYLVNRFSIESHISYYDSRLIKT